MKAISLTQPWAMLVARGDKHYETRSWASPLRGRIAIHASKSFPKPAQVIMASDLFRKTLLDSWNADDEFMPLGKIVAVADLVDCQHTEVVKRRDKPSEKELAFGDWTAGRYAWKLDGVIYLPKPIPCVGALMFWPLPRDVEAAVLRQIGERP